MNELEEKIRQSKAINVLLNYLQDNNLLEDVIKHLTISKENGEVINKLSFYQDKNGKLLSNYEVNLNNLDKSKLEKMIIYRYEELSKLYFDNNLVEEKKILNNTPSKSYNQIKRTYQPLKLDEQLIFQQLHILINEYPYLLIEIILYYNISIDELIKSDNKKLVLN